MLRHHKLGGESAEQHTVGWIHYLERLRVAAGGGDPGPDEGRSPARIAARGRKGTPRDSSGASGARRR
jgi:hypothetical protein